MYGSTEAEPVAHIEAPLRLERTARRSLAGYCIGRPSRQVQLKVVRIHKGPIQLDDAGWSQWEQPIGEVGELVVRGAHVAKSYFHNKEATLENKIRDAAGEIWHRMGDTGYLDEEGYVWLVGRVHSTIHRGGIALHPQLIEQAGMAEDQQIQRIAAVGLPNGELGERLMVVIESQAIVDVCAIVRARIESAGFPVDEVRLTDKPLPLDPRHRSKIDYTALRQRLLR